MTTAPENTYDKRDMIRLEGSLTAGGLRIASYRVRDPETGEFGGIQYHMTYNNMVMAVLGEEAAKLLVRFITGPKAF